MLYSCFFTCKQYDNLSCTTIGLSGLAQKSSGCISTIQLTSVSLVSELGVNKIDGEEGNRRTVHSLVEQFNRMAEQSNPFNMEAMVRTIEELQQDETQYDPSLALS